MSTVRVSERVSPQPFDRSAVRVDSDAGTISGAVICGFESVNRRRYGWRDGKLPARIALYEGARVNLNHSKDGRTFQEWVGVVRGPHAGPDGRPVAGKIQLFKSDPYAAKVLEAARECPEKFGLSHVVRAVTRREGGVDVVEDIEAVESVDIVVDPASVKGLFEGVEREPRPVTLGELVESVEARAEPDRRRDLRRFLVEMDGDPVLAAPAGDLPPADADPDAALWGGFTAAIGAILDQYKSGAIDAAEAGKQVGRYVKAHARLMKSTSGEEKPAEEKPAESALKAENDRLARENAVLRLAGGVKLSEAQRKALGRLDTDDERKALLESFKAQPAGETPRAAHREGGAKVEGGKAAESKGGGADGLPQLFTFVDGRLSFN
jgi:hypothetical protein